MVEDDRLTGVELTDGRVIARTAVFIRPANVPHADGLLAGLGCEVDDGRASSPSTPTGRTSTPGVWAAGNVADPRAQVITAAGAGSAAAIAINADLVRDDVERAAALEHERRLPLLREPGVDELHGHRALADRGGAALGRAGADVAGGEDAGHARLEQAVGCRRRRR